jgi:hypothetical protein
LFLSLQNFDLLFKFFNSARDPLHLIVLQFLGVLASVKRILDFLRRHRGPAFSLAAFSKNLNRLRTSAFSAVRVAMNASCEAIRFCWPLYLRSTPARRAHRAAICSCWLAANSFVLLLGVSADEPLP